MEQDLRETLSEGIIVLKRSKGPNSADPHLLHVVVKAAVSWCANSENALNVAPIDQVF